MRNPFEYGGVVSGKAFCNREKELADLLRAMENAEKLFLFSERRYGKTSLVRAALSKLPKKGYVCAYVDLWPTDSEGAFVTTVAKAIAESMSTSVERVLETAKKFFGSLAPSVTTDEQGKPALTLGLGRHARIGPALDEVLETPARIAAKGGPRVVFGGQPLLMVDDRGGNGSFRGSVPDPAPPPCPWPTLLCGLSQMRSWLASLSGWSSTSFDESDGVRSTESHQRGGLERHCSVSN